MVGQDGQKQILTVPGANGEFRSEDIEDLADVLSLTKVILVQLEISISAISTALELAKKANIKIVLDPASPNASLSTKTFQDIDVVKPNAAEAEAITGIKVINQASGKTAANKILSFGAKAVSVEIPSEGNLLVTNEGEYFVPHFPIQSIDATGAGDAFSASLAVMLSEGKDLRFAVKFASAAAALKTKSLGAQDPLPYRDEVISLLSKDNSERK